ncbi:MAG: hypothetical protein Q8Q39_02140 [bacterium]|nr:hypothetical protein [bacterium]
MRKNIVRMVLVVSAALTTSGVVLAHGESAAEKLHPATQIGLIDSRSGHEHGGGGADMSMNYEPRVEPSGVLAVSTPVDLRITIHERLAEMQIKNFLKTHTKEMHLIIVSPDMEEFYHEHPVLQVDGSFLLKGFSFPREIVYTLFFDLQPAGTSGILLENTVTVGAGTVPALEVTPSLFPIKIDGISLDIATDPAAPRTIGITEMRFSLSHKDTGKPVDDIQAYLGAPAHLVMLPASFSYLHVHPIGDFPEDPAKLDAMNFGPEIIFHASFPEAGLYKGWLQFQRRGQNVQTIPFVMNVEPGIGLTRNQVGMIVHDVQMEEEARSAVKFIVLAVVLGGILWIFYPKRPQPIPQPIATDAQSSQTPPTVL